MKLLVAIITIKNACEAIFPFRFFYDVTAVSKSATFLRHCSRDTQAQLSEKRILE